MWALLVCVCVYVRVHRSKFEGISPNDLEYSVCIAPVLSDVLRDREDLYRSQPQVSDTHTHTRTHTYSACRHPA